MKTLFLLFFLTVFFNISRASDKIEYSQQLLIKPLPSIGLFDLKINPKPQSRFFGEVNAFFDTIQWVSPSDLQTILTTIEPHFWPSMFKKNLLVENSSFLDIPLGFAEDKGQWKTLSPDAQDFLLFRFGKWILWLEKNGNIRSAQKVESTRLIAAEVKDSDDDPTPIYFHYFQGQYPKIKSVVPFKYFDPVENKMVDCIGMLTEDDDKSRVIEAFELESQERIIRLVESELTETSPEWEWLLTSHFDFMPVRFSDPKDLSSLDIPLAVGIETTKTNFLLSPALVNVFPKKGEIILVDQKEKTQKIKDTEDAFIPRLGPDGTVGWIQKDHLVLYRFGRVIQYFPFEGSFSLNWCFSNHGKEACLYSRKPLKRKNRILLGTNLFLYWFADLKTYTDYLFSFEEIFTKYDTHSGLLIERVIANPESSLEAAEKLPLWAKALKVLNQFYFE
ncbi:hypothetical protein IT6_07655 [Methylacidiphilum caldifontis]|uniref:hypothetical protein n=1 Tax=Methylacidiphilum caldifontis TaxID=2795386 RepID=UPI001A8C99A7|nr:hypothetical protein [Methylacidiphilum caldifontis]QSR88254.1 hypothetical protein IT6_07655 [Methylacidiphilum caldifontis]